MKYVCSIDGSLKETGIAIFTEKGKLLESFSIPTSPNDDTKIRLKQIYTKLEETRKKYDISEVAIEESFVRFHNATRKLFMVRGILELMFYDCNLHVYSPRTIKKVVTGNAKAEKDEVANEIFKKYPKMKWNNSYDTTDAIACGFTYFEDMKAEK